MGPKQAILNGLTGSFRFSGRIGRSEFWWFAPVAAVPPALLSAQIDWNRLEFFGIWRIVAVTAAALPLLAAMSRRLQDMGEPGHHALYPFMPLILLWVGYLFTLYVSLATLMVGLGIVIGWGALMLLMPLYLIALLASFVLAGSITGMLLVPSDRSANRYGPNPDEVTP